MDFLVLLEDRPEHSAVLARVDSVPESMNSGRRARDVVTLYGTPTPESLALALAAAMESHSSAGAHDADAFRHVGVWPERGAVGDAAWRDSATGELVIRDLDIPLDVLTLRAREIFQEFGTRLQRLVAGLVMPDWPDGVWRAMAIHLDVARELTGGARSRTDGFLDELRVADGLAFEYEGD